MSDNIATCKQMLLYGLLCFVVGYGLGCLYGYTSASASKLMSCAELQEKLNSGPADPNLVVDGKCGTKTQNAWDLAYNQQCALETWPK